MTVRTPDRPPPMDANEARRLILAEGGDGPDPIYMTIREGHDPGPERMRRLTEAVLVVAAAEAGKPALDRNLTAALWVIGHVVAEQFSLWPDDARAARPSLEMEVLNLAAAVEDVFLDTPQPQPPD